MRKNASKPAIVAVQVPRKSRVAPIGKSVATLSLSLVFSSLAFFILWQSFKLMGSRFHPQDGKITYPLNNPHPGGKFGLESIAIANDKRFAKDYFFGHLADFCNECDFDFYRKFLRRIPCCKAGNQEPNSSSEVSTKGTCLTSFWSNARERFMDLRFRACTSSAYCSNMRPRKGESR